MRTQLRRIYQRMRYKLGEVSGAWQTSGTRRARQLGRLRVFLTDLGLAMAAGSTSQAAGPVTRTLAGMTISGFNPKSLRYLMREVLYEGTYAFEAGRPDPLIIDCGANIGLAALFFKRLYPASRVIAIEPNPQAYALLERNVADNQLQQVTLVNAALASAAGEAELYFDSGNGGLTGSFNADRGGSQSIRVDCVRLSELIGTQEPDLVKMDIEGAEWLVLEELASSGALGRVKRYLIEYHHRIDGDRSRLSAFLAMLEKAGFEYRLATEPKPGRVFQDVLIDAVRG